MEIDKIISEFSKYCDSDRAQRFEYLNESLGYILVECIGSYEGKLRFVNDVIETSVKTLEEFRKPAIKEIKYDQVIDAYQLITEVNIFLGDVVKLGIDLRNLNNTPDLLARANEALILIWKAHREHPDDSVANVILDLAIETSEFITLIHKLANRNPVINLLESECDNLDNQKALLLLKICRIVNQLSDSDPIFSGLSKMRILEKISMMLDEIKEDWKKIGDQELFERVKKVLLLEAMGEILKDLSPEKIKKFEEEAEGKQQ